MHDMTLDDKMAFETMLSSVSIETLTMMQERLAQEIRKRITRPSSPSITQTAAGGCWNKICEDTRDDDIPLEDVDTTVRTYNMLKRAGINNLRQIYNLPPNHLWNVRNLGHKGAREIIRTLEEKGFDYEGRWHINVETYRKEEDGYV